jgi:hypothetical protein
MVIADRDGARRRRPWCSATTIVPPRIGAQAHHTWCPRKQLFTQTKLLSGDNLTVSETTKRIIEAQTIRHDLGENEDRAVTLARTFADSLEASKPRSRRSEPLRRNPETAMSEILIRCNRCGTSIWGTTARQNDAWRGRHALEHTEPAD